MADYDLAAMGSNLAVSRSREKMLQEWAIMMCILVIDDGQNWPQVCFELA